MTEAKIKGKGRGRPLTGGVGFTERISLRMMPADIGALEELRWRLSETFNRRVGKSEAVRRAVYEALEARR